MMRNNKRKMEFFILLATASLIFPLLSGIAEGKNGTMVSQEELQRCVERKKLEARKAGRPDYDIMDFRYRCYNELMRKKK